MEQASGMSIEDMFELVQQRLGHCDELLVKLEQLDEELRARPDLFDPDDIQLIAKRHATLTSKRQNIQAAFEEAAAWYKSRITNLRTLVASRAQVLEQLDEQAGLLSADPAIMEFMTQKQAHYNSTIVKIEQDLTRKIRERLVPYTEIL